MNSFSELVCFSHLRWKFVLQRPQHLLSRCAKEHKVYFIEEPVFENGTNMLRIEEHDGVTVVTPQISQTLDPENRLFVQQALLTNYLNTCKLTNYVSWYYTPMALDWVLKDNSTVCVYDCMDELSLFKGAPARLTELEVQLFKKADLVFTGGVSLYEHKRKFHPRVYAFPSSVDVKHFSQAGNYILPEPQDQAGIPTPRFGFCGVIDERLNIDLLAQVADLRPHYQFVMIGPVVKIDPAELPRRPNIHYIGSKSYNDLPSYMASWQVAIMPFALNDSTKYISPTKTPEYLAAGCPVISTPVTDVVRPYGEKKLVLIANSAEEFAKSCDEALCLDRVELMQQVDEFLKHQSWDITWRAMQELINGTAQIKTSPQQTEITIRQTQSRYQ